MKVIYDYDANTKTCTCSTCGYRLVIETKVYGEILVGDESFIEMEGFELHSTDRSNYYPTHHQHTVYACPKCGTLQIEI